MTYYRDTPPHYDDPETPEEIEILESARKYIRKQIEDIKSEIDVLKDRVENLEYADDYLFDALSDVRHEYTSRLVKRKEQHEDEGKER